MKASPRPALRPPARFEVIAHRGLSGLAPENTLAAFREAIGSGADRVEFDVLITRDGVPVVIHDDTVDRTTSGCGLVESFSLEELRRLDAGGWLHARFRGERVPTLDEVLELCAGRLPVNVEIKQEAVRPVRTEARGGIEEKVAESLRRHGLLESATVSSFEPLALERLARLEPRIVRETLFDGKGRLPVAADVRAAAEAGSRCFSVSREELRARPALVEEAREAGLGVKVYTVDDPAECRRLVELGVAGLFTNRPDLVARLLRSGATP